MLRYELELLASVLRILSLLAQFDPRYLAAALRHRPRAGG